MQIYAQSGRWYLPLIPVMIVSVVCDYSVGHTICLICFTVIYFVGVGQQIYYNMAFAILLGILCLLFNIEQAANSFSKLAKSDASAMLSEILSSFTTYALLLEGVYLIVAIFQGFKKYQQFRAETFALLSEQE